jgi:hypothetical protein
VWIGNDGPLTYNMFGLMNKVVHHLLTPHFLVWFVKWNELISHHFIPHRLIISNNMMNEFIPTKIVEWTHDAPPYLELIDYSNQTPH